MLKTILVGLDGSPYSQAAAELARAWARQFEARLVGLGIIDEPGIRGAEPVPLGASFYRREEEEARLAAARRKVEHFLAEFERGCAQAGAACQLLTVTGRPYEQILLEAQRCDLIVLGQQTYFHFETQERACDTLQSVLKSAPRPVVTVPDRLRAGSTTLVAYDGSLQAARALQVFTALGLAGSSPIEVLSVAARRDSAERSCALAVDYLGAHRISAQPHPLASERDPGALILKSARRRGARLVVMGAYGQPTLREFVLGSVTRTVLKETTVPLFLYH
jgi:nucleotide-binding universal stress UspA family protein